MHAEYLARVLAHLSQDTDLSDGYTRTMGQRFESLRAYAKLPRGRANRAQRLSDQQIASAVLGLTSSNPALAGHVATVLEHLIPVGNETDGIDDCNMLGKAIRRILSDREMRDRLVSVQLTMSPIGSNTNGLGIVSYTDGDKVKKIVFVSRFVWSLLQPGADFDPDSFAAPVIRNTILNRSFFDGLAREIHLSRLSPPTVLGDGSEYDQEDAIEERRKRLHAGPSARFLNLGVENQVSWPSEETLIHFEGYKLVLLPRTKETVQSVHIDLYSNELSSKAAKTLINRFLSLLCWCEDQFAVLQEGWVGGSLPVPVPKRDLAFTTTPVWVFNRTIPKDEALQKALALYREGRNAEQNYMVGCAVLSYFKILEISYPEGKNVRKWISKKFQIIANNYKSDEISRFKVSCGSETIENYLWKACRIAVAHASVRHPSDPDIEKEQDRLCSSAFIMRQLARHFIREELGMSDLPYETIIPILR